MRKRFIKKNIIVFLMTSMIPVLVGCNYLSKGQKENRLKELLREKYGEEFVVRELYENGAIQAWCYPIQDNSLVFSVTTSSKMEKIEMDEYIQRIVGRQIDSEIQPLANNCLGNCYVSTNIPLGATTGFPSHDKSTFTFDSLLDYEKDNNIPNFMMSGSKAPQLSKKI